MKIYGGKTYEQMSEKAASVIAAQVIENPRSVLGLATGSTPIGLYGFLAKWYEEKYLSFKECKTVNLDEYCGIGPDHDQSYAYFMRENLFSKIDILPENTNIPNGLNPDAAAECARYDKVIEDLGYADVQLLGLGNNGHIGFNEPAPAFVPGVNHVKLTDSTINANARFFASREEVPKSAYTMGIKGIMNAKKVLLVANGTGKAEILEKALFGPVTPEVPASVLQLHRDVVVCADEAALSVIAKKHPDAVEWFR